MPSPLPRREKEKGGWRHSRLIQWLVPFAVVHPGQHFPPQTFLLSSHQHGVRYKDIQRGTTHRAPPRALPHRKNTVRLHTLSRSPREAAWHCGNLQI